jgi:hypothetical protein
VGYQDPALQHRDEGSVRSPDAAKTRARSRRDITTVAVPPEAIRALTMVASLAVSTDATA